AIVLALGLSALAFGLSHLGNRNASAVTTSNIVLGGLAFGLPYVLTGELAMSLGLHFAWNFCQGTVYGFPVSDHAPAQPMLVLVQAGRAFGTGGQFGPEGGLLGVVAIFLSFIVGLLWIGWRQERLTICASLPIPGLRPPPADKTA